MITSFLRFTQWKVEQTGVVGMITNHSYLTTPPSGACAGA
jgi:hypothetical protein